LFASRDCPAARTRAFGAESDTAALDTPAITAKIVIKSSNQRLFAGIGRHPLGVCVNRHGGGGHGQRCGTKGAPRSVDLSEKA
jgi:hypothetical protein